MKLKLKWGPKTHLQLPLIATAAVEDSKMKIFYNLYNYNWLKLSGRVKRTNVGAHIYDEKIFH